MYESAPWRTELRRFAVTLRDAPLWPGEDVPFELERAIFYSGVVLRKLIEDRKLTDFFTTKNLRIPAHTATAPEKSSIWRNVPGSVEFDWQKSTLAEVTVYELCCQIVHFFGRYWWIDEEDSLCGMIVCSYRLQDRQGFFINFNMWADLLNEAADAWPTKISFGQGVERKGN